MTQGRLPALGALLLVVALLASTSNAASYTVTVGVGFATATSDGSTVLDAVAPVSSAGTVAYGAFVLNVPAVASDFAALTAAMPPALTAASDCSSVAIVGAGVFACAERLEAPLVSSYLGDVAGGLLCKISARDLAAFNCSSESGAVLVVFEQAMLSSASVTVSFVVDASVPASVAEKLVLLSLARGRDMLDMAGAAVAVAKSNDARMSETRIAAAFIYLFVAVGMTGVAGILAIWCGWLLPIAGSVSESVYFGLWFVLLHGISWAAGLAGWIAILSIAAFALLVLPIVYVCIRFFHARLVIKKNALVAGEQQESDSTELTADDDDADTDADASTVESEKDPSNVDEPLEVPNEPRAFAFTKQPFKLGRRQAWLLFAGAIVLLASTIICIVIFFAWGIDSYYLWDRTDGIVVDEFQPKLVAKSIGLLYGWDRWASILRVDWLLQAQTKACGVYFKKTLKTDSEKKTKIYDAFIKEYGIDMSLFDRPDYRQYTSVNDWFTRALAAGARPVANELDDSVVVSPADCRLVVYQSIDADLHVWLKGQSFTVNDMLKYADIAAPYVGGTIAIFRLAPADYHLTHSPIAGTITAQYFVKSTLYSVGADAMRSNSGAIYNTRMISTIAANPANPSSKRQVAFIAIGATCVGSVFMTKGSGAAVAKGEQIQGFAFGGSTVVVLFPPGSVQFDQDILYNSARGMETLVRVNTRVADWIAE